MRNILISLAIFLLLGTGTVSSGEEGRTINFRSSPKLIKSGKSILDGGIVSYSFGNYDTQAGLYDCSSFVVEAVKRSGEKCFPRSSRGQFELLRKTGKVWLQGYLGWDNLRAGDFIFFSGTFSHDHNCPVSHVMIYAGGNLMIGAQPNGIGFFYFEPRPPLGQLEGRGGGLRTKETVYAYARPNWSKIRKFLKNNPWILIAP